MTSFEKLTADLKAKYQEKLRGAEEAIGNSASRVRTEPVGEAEAPALTEYNRMLRSIPPDATPEQIHEAIRAASEETGVSPTAAFIKPDQNAPFGPPSYVEVSSFLTGEGTG